jgi:hypothetical protein
MRKVLAIMLLLAGLMPVAVSAAEDGKVQVITHFSNAAKCISPVAIKKIDGREATVQRMGFWIEPGTHTLSGSALIDTSFCQTIGSNSQRYRPEPLEVDFELGKVYYIGYDHSSQNRKDWEFVVWKIEDAKE